MVSLYTSILNLNRHKKTHLKDGVGIMFFKDGAKYEG
jgi:hypothetical protein